MTSVRPGLRPGQHVRLVAPAGAVPEPVLAAGLALVREWGVRVSVGEHVLADHPTLPYLAGTDADRAADLLAAWRDPAVDAVFCVRGGYGCLRLLDVLDWPALAEVEPKLLVGSSDVTALQYTFGARLGAPAVFGPMVATAAFTGDQPARDLLHTCLFEPAAPVVVTGKEAGALVCGQAEGTTVGGNLSLLAGLVGGELGDPPPAGSILLLEDVTEEPYRLDRMLVQLRRAGWFGSVCGIALGSWTDCGPPAELRAMLTDHLAGLGVPVAWGLDFGHCAGQASIPLGRPAHLDADTGQLTVR